MIVLALDLSKTSRGWAVGDGRTWLSGALKCPHKPPEDMKPTDIDAAYTGAIADWLRRSLHALIEEHHPQYAAVEKPLPGNLTERKKFFRKDADMAGQSLVAVSAGGTSFATTHHLHGLCYEACGLLYRKAIPTVFVSAQTWRRSLGIGQPPKGIKDRRKWLKAEATAQLKLRGFNISQPDAAEACCLGIHLLGALNIQARVGQLL